MNNTLTHYVVMYSEGPAQTSSGKVVYNSACAAPGQLGLMALYETMFNQYDIQVSTYKLAYTLPLPCYQYKLTLYILSCIDFTIASNRL